MVGVWVKKGILERICECTTIERKEKHKESMRKSNWLDQGGKRESKRVSSDEYQMIEWG